MRRVEYRQGLRVVVMVWEEGSGEEYDDTNRGRGMERYVQVLGMGASIRGNRRVDGRREVGMLLRASVTARIRTRDLRGGTLEGERMSGDSPSLPYMVTDRAWVGLWSR